MITTALYVACYLLTAHVSGSPASGRTNALNSHSTLIYNGSHQISHLGVLFDDDESITNKIVFFIQTDFNKGGHLVNYGLFALTKDDDLDQMIVSRLLDNARDIVIVSITKAAYFAAEDGIYLYNRERNTADKYGSVNDNVISIAADNATGELYYVNNNHQVYKVTEDGHKFTIVDDIKNAEQITIDFIGNIYYYTVYNQVHVYNGQSVIKVKGIPMNTGKFSLVRTPVLVPDYGFVNVGDEYYAICGANGTARSMSRGQHVSITVTALSADTGYVVYYATNKNIYQFNLLEKLVESMMTTLSSGLGKVLDNMRSLFDFH